MLVGGSNLSDHERRGPTGEFDSPVAVVGWGVIAPIVCVVVAVCVIINGGVTLQGRGVSSGVRYHGLNAVLSSVAFLVGIALLLIANYLLPNLFRRSYRYQYVAIAGTLLSAGGLLWFVIAAML